MSDSLETSAPESEQPRTHRRNLIAGAAALAVGLFARSATQVAADNGDPIRAGQTTTAQSVTTLSVNGAPTNISPVFFVFNPTAGVGVRAQTSNYAGVVDPANDGVQGFAVGSENSGTFGRNDSLNAVGAFGVASNGTGVAGQSTGGSGVSGNSTSGNGGNFVSNSGAGLFAQSGSGFGIVANSANNPAVLGQSSNSIGVRGIGNGAFPYGVVGETNTNGGFALLGQTAAPGSVAFGGTSFSASALAGQFIGDVTHFGSIILQRQTAGTTGNAFVVGPGVSKNAAVLHPDGSHRLMHCVEAPEPWFEDFGEGKLSAGRAEVRFDEAFTSTVDTRTMHVFVNEVGTSSNLGITKNARGFSVEADATLLAMRGRRMTDATNAFSYRVVAKRKDVSGERFAKFRFPDKIETKQFTTPAPQAPIAPARRATGTPQRG